MIALPAKRATMGCAQEATVLALVLALALALALVLVLTLLQPIIALITGVKEEFACVI